MATAVDVMKYIKSQMNLMGEVQLQKLAYYAQAWSLAWDGTPLFTDRIEAWRMGPVVPTLRFRADAADAAALDGAARATVDAVIEFYGRHHGQALAAMAHAETPWADAWSKRPEGSDRCDEVITHDAMRRFYTAKVLNGEEKPERQRVVSIAPDDQVLEIAAANAKRWSETLEILSR